MLDTIKSLLDLIEKLSQMINQRFGTVPGLYYGPGGKITPSQRIVKYLRQNLIIILAVILVILTVLHFITFYRYTAASYNITPDLSNFLSKNVSFVLNIFVVFIFIVSMMLLFFSWWSENVDGKRNSKFVRSFILVTMAHFGLFAAEPRVIDYIEADSFQLAYNYYLTGKHQRATELFDTLAKLSQNQEAVANAQQYGAGAAFFLGDFETSVEGYAKFMYENPTLVRDEHIKSLGWAIYRLGKKFPYEEAEAILLDIRKRYQNEELSPFWLVINPAQYEHFINDRVRMIGRGDPMELSILRILLATYPKDRYADLAQILLGEYQLVADNPQSRYRDWAIYKTAQASYFQKNYQKAIKYFNLFIKKYPQHRWADDAAYRLAKSNQFLGDYSEAVNILLGAAYWPDGDMETYNRKFLIALIDSKLNSEEIKKIIEEQIMNHKSGYLPLLEFCLAEQLFKEGNYQVAKEQFTRVIDEYPNSFEAEFVSNNIRILDEIILIQSLNPSESAIDIAKYLVRNPTTLQSKALIIYNDLYNGTRRVTLLEHELLDWSYVEMTNDHYHAAKMAEIFAKNSPGHPRASEALYVASIGYYNLTFKSAFLPGYDFQENLENSKRMYQKLENISQQMLDSYPQSIYSPQALELTAIAAERFNEEKSIEYMLKIVKMYPRDRLSNNALIYVARLYRSRAERSLDPDVRNFFYRQSEIYYNRVLKEYPDGHVGQEARQELQIIQEILSP